MRTRFARIHTRGIAFDLPVLPDMDALKQGVEDFPTLSRVARAPLPRERGEFLRVRLVGRHRDVRVNHNDFRLYYAGAQVGLRYGWSHIYDINLHQAAVAALLPAGPWYALLTPAPITWLVAPLTVFGYPAAYWLVGRARPALVLTGVLGIRVPRLGG